MKKISFPSNNQTVTGTLHFPKKLKENSPAVIFVHGWTSDESGYYPRAQALTSLGFICLTINLRGHGTSSGKLEDYSRKDPLDDVLAACDFLGEQKFIDKKNINIVAASYGAYLAAILASKRKVEALALRAPALYLNTEFDIPTVKLIADREDEFFKDLEPEKDNLALEGIKQVNKVLIIESGHDQIIPHRIIKLYKKAARNKNVAYEVIEDADHQLSEEKWKQEFIEILRTWFFSLSS